LEASIGVSTLTLVGALKEPTAFGSEPTFHRVADNDIGIHIDVRMFADLFTINGAFVPSVRANIFNYGENNDKLIDFSAGLGINVNIDRGFFWSGFEGLYNSKANALVRTDNVSEQNGALSTSPQYERKDIMGGKVGFGIERNVLTDWFIIRVGGAKLLAKESFGSKGSHGSQWIETNDVDHVSLGMGVNIEDRLKIDFTIAQNLPYTFTSLFSSSGNPYLASRVSAVFSF